MRLLNQVADLSLLLGKVRQLTTDYKSGGKDSAKAFRDLMATLLSITVLKNNATIRLFQKEKSKQLFVLGGTPDITDPLPLNDGRFLRYTISFYVDIQDNSYLKVDKASYQYQLHKEDDKQWLFRYDYLRIPDTKYPPSHLQINGSFPNIITGISMPKTHFPTGRVSIESIIRLLIEQFNVPPNEPPEIWRPVLTESEKLFYEIAKRPLSGPAL